MLDHGFDDEHIYAMDGKTMLLLACENGRTMIVKVLLSRGLDPNVPDYNGYTCLQVSNVDRDRSIESNGSMINRRHVFMVIL